MIRNLPIAVALAIAAWPGSAEPQEPPTRRVVERAEDLPRHTYPVTTIAALLEDDAQFAVLAERVEADLISDLMAYEIADVATLKRYFGILSDLALQRGEYAPAAAWQDSIRAREEKPALRQLSGIVERALAAASRADGADFEAGFRENFRREVSALPFADVPSELRMMRQGMEFTALPNAAAMGRSAIERLVHDGRLSLEAVQQLVRMRAMLDRLVPVREAMVAVLDEVIASNEGVAKPEIWAARDVSLDGRDGLAPVLVAIWDSGVDVDLFPGRVFVNPGEVAGNGADDDANGFVDDVHGIAHDLNHDRAAGVLARIALSAEQRAEYAEFLKGSVDIRWGVQSAEAQAYRRKMASISPADIAPWIEGMNQYFDYVHGTHVAGVALRGNPAARVLVARNEEDHWRLVSQLVTLESERKRAREIRETVEYFRRNGVRVVNMSWALDPGFYAGILQQNRAGGDATERSRLAREMFDTVSAALHSAIEGAPEILFVAAAMNQDADNRFQQQVPASFDLPNVITVGALDNAGNEAAFTSYGKVDVYASGVDVLSFVPGGVVVPISGTSMAAPQVVNLAAKLLVLRPELSVAELRRIILETADEKTTGEARSIRLLNPKATIERVTGLADSAVGERLDRVLPFLNERLASPPIEWMPCPFDSSELAFDRFRVDPSRLRCGQILVPEDRSRADGRSLRLTFTIVKAEHPASGAAPVVYLEGGPGVAGLNAYVLGFEAPALATERDVITFDHRGTGRSEPLCPALDGREREVVRRDLRDEQAAALRRRARQECLDELRRLDVDPSAYDMAATVADVEDLRRALGIERWTLLGRSYGGALAQRIMRHHPHTVHSVMLINPLPLDWLSVAEWVPTFARTLRRIAEECAADRACREAFGNPLDELLRAYDRTETEPWTVDVATSDFGAPSFTINGTDLIALIDALLYAAENTSYLPRLIRSLAERDSAVAAAVVGRVFAGGPFEFWPAVQYSVWCRDAVTADFRERLAAAVADHAPALQAVGFPVEVCDGWPVVAGPAHERLPVESDIPTLILSGGRDHVVPAALGTAMLSGLRNGRQIVFPFSAHVLPERSNVDCVLAIMHAFLANPRGAIDTSCVGRIERRPYSTELPEWMTDAAPSQQRQPETVLALTAGAMVTDLSPAPAAIAQTPVSAPAYPADLVRSSTLISLIAADPALHAQLPDSVQAPDPAARGEEPARPFIEWTGLPPHIEMPHQLRDSVRFGYLHVPRDHAHPTGPMMRMAFAIVPATAPDPAPDPVVFIVGGPGFAGIAPHFRNRLRGPHPLDVHRGRRDLIVFDQRGNGLSDPRRCPEVTGAASPQFDTDADSPEENVWLETLASCRRQLLAEGVRLETISSVQVAHDLEWLRRALGLPQLNLIGTSYGSRVAAEAVRQIPAAIRVVNFSGPVPPGSHRLDSGPEQAEEVLLTLFRRCAERPACHAAYPRLKAEYDSVLARLRQAPFAVRLSPSDLGPGGELLVDDAVMRAGLADLLVNRDLAAGVPLLIHTVFERGESFLVRMAPQLARQLLAGDQDLGTALAFWCNDGAVNRFSEELLRQRCRAWIGEEWDHGGAEPLRSDVPALVDTGELDPRTPPSDARALAAGLPRAHLVIVPWYGHEEPAPCALRIARDFIDAPERAPDTACLDSIPPIDFVTGVAYSSWIGAAVTRTWQRPWLAGLPGLAALLLLVSAVGIPLRDLRGHDLRRTPARRTASFALLLVALVGLTLILGLTAALTAAARQHLFIPAIGLPENRAWLLALPWVLLVLAPVAAVVALLSRGAGHSLGPAGWSALIGSGLILTTWLVNLLA